MSIQELAADIVDLVQQETSGKISTPKITKQVLSKLNKFVHTLAETDQEDRTVVVQLCEGVPTAVFTNHAALEGALYVCTDNISVSDDEESAVLVVDDNIVVGTGIIGINDSLYLYSKAAIKFDKNNT